tara:strand:- start:1634 stop:2422 length:789 start_codon:yes stop_codon:yes gene_type:complete
MTNMAVVFDMDETLGSFQQLYKFWVLTCSFLNKNDLADIYFFTIVDNFPLFLRPDFNKILKSLKKLKLNNICSNVMIYTNNNGPNEWANIIKRYLNHIVKYELFDNIIRAFKINGKQIEICRTSYGKSYKDFISCTKLPTNTKVCFIDDIYHEEMIHDNVFYINIEPYHHNEDYMKLCEFFYRRHHTLFFGLSLEKYKKYIFNNTYNHNLNHLNKSSLQKNIEYLLTGEILKMINEFFKDSTSKKTCKNKTYISKNKTKKQR